MMRRPAFGAIALLACLLAIPAGRAYAASPAGPDSLGIKDLLDIATARIADLSPDGHWLAVTVGTRRDALGTDFFHDSDPSYLHVPLVQLLVIDTRTGTPKSVWPAKQRVRDAAWAPDNARLGLLVMDKDALQVMVWNRTTGRFTTAKLPAGTFVAENSELKWTADGTQLAFATHTDAWRAKVQARFVALTSAPVVVLDSRDPFLEWDEMRRWGSDRAIVAWNPTSGAIATVAPDAMIGSWTLARDNSAVSIQEDIADSTNYEQGNREFRLVTEAWGGANARTLLPNLRSASLQWADDGIHYAYSQNGRVFVAAINDTTPHQILGPVGGSGRMGGSGRSGRAGGRGAGSGVPDSLRFTPVRWSPSGDAIAAANREGIWVVNVATGEKHLAMPNSDTTQTSGGGRGGRGALQGWSHDGRWMYFADNAKTKWAHAIVRYDRQTDQRSDLVKDAKHYTNLQLSDDGSTAALMVGEPNHVPDVYVADQALGGMKRVVEANPQLATKPIAKAELISYLDADGVNRYGVLRYPVDYQPGTRYPTVFIIYEDFFEANFDAMANLLAAHGYAVVEPSVGFEIGYPGEAWLKGVTAAANKVIEMGVADSARLGVHGTSYGGYAVNLLVTQTHRFKAAINMSGKVDIISFYTDSPRLGARNISAAERSQDRIGASLWAQPQKYVQHSAVMFADRITTPLLLLTGGQDHNVPQLNEREMYYALRRLGKTVVWASYTNSGHGTPQTTESDFMDYNQRVLDWYAKYLGPDAKASTTATEGGR